MLAARGIGTVIQARCDVESMEYSYSFDPELEQEWVWPDKYSKQSDILRYANHVAERYDLLKDIQFETRIKSAFYDRDTNTWTIETTEGQEVRAQYCIMAVGNLSTPRVPDFKGVDSFKGDWYHSGLWPKEEVDFSGKRVGIIGTGSTAIQIIPHVAQQAKHLTIFQRTANYSLPARNGPLPEDVRAAHKKKYRELREQAYFTPFGIAGYPPPKKGAIEATPEERDAKYHAKWAEGGTISYLFSYTDLLLSEESNKTASDFVRERIRDIVKDPATAELLCPNDHPIGTKRICLDSGYYETFNRDNVSLVDVRSAPIEELHPTAFAPRKKNSTRLAHFRYRVRCHDRCHPRDGRPHVRRRRHEGAVEGRAENLSRHHGFRFSEHVCDHRPGQPGRKVADDSLHRTAHGLDYELHREYARQGYQPCRGRRRRRGQVGEHVNEVANSTLYPQANSWYVGANIPGKPRIFMPYVGGVEAYKKICDEVVEKGYEGITLSP